jgi:autotransporter-associated beta strand protein
MAQVEVLWNPPDGGPGNWDTTSMLWSSTYSYPPDTIWSNTTDNYADFYGIGGVIAVQSAGIKVHYIFMDSDGYTFSGGTLTLNNSLPMIAVLNSTDTTTINSAISATDLYIASINGTSGSGAYTYGSGTLVLGASNAITGTLYVGGYASGQGTLQIKNSGALGTGAVDIGGNTSTIRLELDGGSGALSISSLGVNGITIHGRSGASTYPLPTTAFVSPQIVNSGGNNTIASLIKFDTGGSYYTLQSDDHTLTVNNISNATTGAGTRVLYLQGEGDGFVNGAISSASGYSGPFSVIKEGGGTWSLTKANSYNAATQIDAGVLRISNNSALGSGTYSGGSGSTAVTVIGGTNTGRLELDGSSSSLTISRAITLQGRSDATDAHLANYSGNNTVSGDILLTDGGTNYVVQSNSGMLTLTRIRNNATSTDTRLVTLQGNGTVNGIIGGGTNSVPNNISIIKSGGGTWTLSGANTYTAATTIQAGTLALSSGGSIASSTPINVSSGATFNVSAKSGYTLYNGQTLSGSGTVTGNVADQSGAIISPGDSTATLTFNNNLTLSGNDAINYDIDGSNGDLLNVNGNLTLNGSTGSETVINISLLSPPTSITYRVATVAGTLTGNSSKIKVNNTSRYVITEYVTSGAGGSINLNIGNSNSPLIFNGSATPNDVWDLKNTKNWLNSGLPDVFYDLDRVTFDDTAANTDVTISGTVQPGTMTIDSVKDYTFSGSGKISGSTGLDKRGSGTTTINTNNDYSGQTKVESGLLFINSGSISNSSGVLITGGTLRIGNSYAMGDNSLGGAAVTISGNGSLDLNGYALADKAVAVAGPGAGGGGAIINSSTSDQQYALRQVTLSGDVTFGGNGRWDIRNPGTGASAYLAGNSHNLTKVGSNVISLADLGETSLHNINVNQGCLMFEGSTTLGDSSGTVTVLAGGTLAMYNNDNVFNKNLILNGGAFALSADYPGEYVLDVPIAISGSGTLSNSIGTTLTVSGAVGGTGDLTTTGLGTTILNNPANAWTGNTTIQNGFLQIGDGGANGVLPDNVGKKITINAGTIFGSGSLDLNFSNDLTLSNLEITGTGNLIMNGSGTVTLGAANSYSGSTWINNGALRLTNSKALGTSGSEDHPISITNANDNNARIELTNNVTIGNSIITLYGRYNTAAHIVNISGNNSITGEVRLVSPGNQYAVRSNSGTLSLNSVTDSLPGDRVLNLTGDGNGIVGGGINFNGVNGSLGIVKNGAGTWTLSGANNYNGGTTILSGALRLAATGSIANSPLIDVNAGVFDVSAYSSYTLDNSKTITGNGTVLGTMLVQGTVKPGEGPGQLSVGNMNFDAGSMLNIELAGNAAGLFDVLNSTGNLNILGGTLSVSLLNDYMPAGGEFFDIMNFSSLSGTFAAVDLPDISALGLSWALDNLYTTGTISVVSGTGLFSGGNNVVPEPASFIFFAAGAFMLLLFRSRGLVRVIGRFHA